MLLAWGLGYGDAWNNKAGRKLPAIWTPYQNRKITAIQYRFIGVAKDDKTADRFGQLKGSKKYVCGLHLAYGEAEPGQLQTLFLVEGELNAVSIYQAIYGLYPADVLSFGAQGNIANADIARMAATVASRYRGVIVWADEPEIALAALDNLPTTARRLAVRSNVNGVKRDANDLLVAGELDDILFGLLKRVQ